MAPRCIGIIDKQKRDYMKRDLGLVRELLLKLEALPMRTPDRYSLTRLRSQGSTPSWVCF
jgi:hypothetical protein